MPTEQIPVGVTITILDSVVYATPSIPVTLTSSVPIQFAPAFAGPFVNYVQGNILTRAFIKSSALGDIKIKKVETFRKSSASYLSPYALRVITDGASNYWRLGETSGLVAVDSVGGANGTISGGVTLGAAGAIGDGTKAMTFDGSTGKIVPAATVTVPSTATIEAWIKATNPGDFLPVVSNFQNPAGMLFCSRNVSRLSFFCLTTSPQAFSGSRFIGDGQWHHAVWVVTTAALTFYVDGQLDATTALASSAAVSATLGIGYDAQNNFFWPGALDEVAIYPRALTPAEIADHYSKR